MTQAEKQNLFTQEHLEQLNANRNDDVMDGKPVAFVIQDGYPWQMLVHHIGEDGDTLTGIVQDCMEVATWGEASLAELERIHQGTHEQKHLRVWHEEDFDRTATMAEYDHAAGEEGYIPLKPGRYCDVCGRYYPGEEPCIQH